MKKNIERFNFRTFLFLGCAGLLLVACSPPIRQTQETSLSTTVAPNIPTTTATVVAARTPQPQTTITPGVTVTDLSSPTMTALPTTQPLGVDLQYICPSQPLVPLSTLGLDPQTRLLVIPETLESVWDETSNGLYTIAPDAPIPQLASSFFQKSQTNSRVYRVSPNGQWLVFQRIVAGTTHGTPWISSSDGKQQWSLSSDPRLEVGVWLDNKTLLLSDSTNTVKEVLDPFARQAEFLSDLPPRQVDGIGAQFFRSAGQTYMIYQAGLDYRLFEPATRKDQRVLDWLRDDSGDFLDKTVVIQPELDFVRSAPSGRVTQG